jgi:hypothetical protein
MITFRARRVSRTHFIQLLAPPDQVFYLFEPEGEKLWAEGWLPEMIYPTTGVTEEGAVFTTLHPGEATRTIWTLVHYAPTAQQIIYNYVIPGSRVTRIEINCAEAEDQTSRVTITYSHTALSEQGNRYIENFTESYYQDYINGWEKAINYYLRHGHILTHHQA